MGATDAAHQLCDIFSMDPDFDGFMRAADDRGDTPLHAAACNGAVACVKMLLQFDAGTKGFPGKSRSLFPWKQKKKSLRST